MPANLRPSVGRRQGDLPAIYNDGCHLDAAVTKPPPCVFGDTAGATTVVLFGDSHAAQWFPALDDIATRHHWRLLVLTKKGCPTAEIDGVQPDGEPPAHRVRPVAGQRGRPAGRRAPGPRS